MGWSGGSGAGLQECSHGHCGEGRSKGGREMGASHLPCHLETQEASGRWEGHRGSRLRAPWAWAPCVGGGEGSTQGAEVLDEKEGERFRLEWGLESIFPCGVHGSACLLMISLLLGRLQFPQSWRGDTHLCVL